MCASCGANSQLFNRGLLLILLAQLLLLALQLLLMRLCQWRVRACADLTESGGYEAATRCYVERLQRFEQEGPAPAHINVAVSNTVTYSTTTATITYSTTTADNCAHQRGCV